MALCNLDDGACRGEVDSDAAKDVLNQIQAILVAFAKKHGIELAAPVTDEARTGMIDIIASFKTEEEFDYDDEDDYDESDN